MRIRRRVRRLRSAALTLAWARRICFCRLARWLEILSRVFIALAGLSISLYSAFNVWNLRRRSPSSLDVD